MFYARLTGTTGTVCPTSTSVTKSSGGQPPLRAALTHQQLTPNGDQEFRTKYLGRKTAVCTRMRKSFLLRNADAEQKMTAEAVKK